MNQKLIIIISLFTILGCENQVGDCSAIGCTIFCPSGYVIDENGCDTCQCIDYRDQYIGDWEFNSYTSVSHPYDPSSSELNWIREITYGNNANTLLIPHGPILEGYEQSCFCYEFEIDELGEINGDTYDADYFNYYFDGYITIDSLYYSTSSGSPFSSTSTTVYGKKIN